MLCVVLICKGGIVLISLNLWILFKYESSTGDFCFIHLLRSLFSYTYDISLNSMYWKNLHSVLVL